MVVTCVGLDADLWCVIQVVSIPLANGGHDLVDKLIDLLWSAADKL